MKYQYIKYRINDWLWNNRDLLVPACTAFGGFIWLLLEPAPEPVVVLVTSILAGYVVNKHSNENWYTCTQGQLYNIHFRTDGINKEKKIELINSIINKLGFVHKYNYISAEGDQLNKLIIDASNIEENVLLDNLRSHFGLYFVTINGKVIYEKGIG